MGKAHQSPRLTVGLDWYGARGWCDRGAASLPEIMQRDTYEHRNDEDQRLRR
jgi:hypothetical protein